MTLFDGYMAVDWSANSVPKRGADSIWIACSGAGGEVLENPATRAEAIARIKEILGTASAAGKRLLCGFDFPFGYPEGTAQAITGEAHWAPLWARIAELIEDAADNTNNRFDAAAQLNRAFPGDGPFWGNGLKREIDGLPRRKPEGWGESLPRNRRLAERQVTTTQEVWKLSGVGSVGGQALTGIAALERLRQEVGAAIWPFEPLGEGHVFAEIYPSVLPPDPKQAVKDAGQVKAVVTALEAHDRTGRLAGHLAAVRDLPAAVAREEAMILGQDDLAGFAAPLAAPVEVAPGLVSRGPYLKSGPEIYAQSFATVKAEADLSGMPDDVAEVAVRLVHACGMVDVAGELAYSDDVVASARAALRAGAPILCDCTMVASGIIRRGLPKPCEVVCTLGQIEVPMLAKQLGTTRSAAAVELWKWRLEGAVVAIGNAPTALFHLLEALDAGAEKPAAIFAFPVGFVGAAESKAALAAQPCGVPFMTLPGRRGGSAMAAAAVNGAAIGLRGDGT